MLDHTHMSLSLPPTHTHRCSPATERRMNSNLLKFFADRVAAKDFRFPLANKFARVVFTVKITSADIEKWFSKSKYMKKLYRCVCLCTRYVRMYTSGLNITLERTIFIGMMKKIRFFTMKILFMKCSVIPDLQYILFSFKCKSKGN